MDEKIFAKLDKGLVLPGKKKLIKLAKQHGFSYYGELLYQWHTIDGRSPKEISETLFIEPGKVLVTPFSVYHSLSVYGMFRKGTVYKKPVPSVHDESRICGCCGLNPVAVDRGFLLLCVSCHTNGGRKARMKFTGCPDVASEHRGNYYSR